MSKMLSLARGIEKSLLSHFGKWVLEVSKASDLADQNISTLQTYALPPATGINQGTRPLTTYQTTALADGARVFVAGSINASFFFRLNSSLSVDLVNVVDGIGPGQFIRDYTYWATQTAWYIDAVNGSDFNTGLTPATALQTDAERQRRVQPLGSIWNIGADTSVVYLNTLPLGDPAIFNIGIKTAGNLRIKGTPTTIYTSPVGGFTAVTALNRAANIPWDVTEVGLGAGRPGQRVRISAGARAGARAWFAKDLGGGRYRISPFGSLNTAGSPIPQTLTLVTPQIGDQFVVETLTLITRIQVNVAYVEYNNAIGQQLTFEDIATTGGMPVIGTLPANTGIFTPMAYGCSFGANPFYGVQNNCLSSGAVYIAPAALSMNLGGLVLGGRPDYQGGGVVWIDMDTLLQATGIRMRLGAAVRMGTVGSFDSAAEGFLIEDVGAARTESVLFSGTDLLYGAGNTTYGITVKSGGKLRYTTKPVVTGGTNDTIVGGIAKAYANIPFLNGYDGATVGTGNGAMIVPI